MATTRRRRTGPAARAVLARRRMGTRSTRYDCGDCPAFCCSVYEKVAVTKRDLRRLAAHFAVDEETAERRLTKRVDGERVLRRRSDPVLGNCCRFLDVDTRRCRIYDARPAACRSYPGQRRCAYYELYSFERNAQGDPDLMPLVQITFPGPRPMLARRTRAKPTSQIDDVIDARLRGGKA